MEKFKNTKGFTLVELLVVVSILTILGTIGLSYYGGYTSEARNTKRISDLGGIKTQVELSSVKGVPILSNVLDSTSSLITNISISGLSTFSSMSGTYMAGNINYQVLGLDKKSYSDPITLESYKIGVTSIRNRFEIAATIEEGDVYYSLVDGNWFPRRETIMWARDPVLLQDTAKGIFYLDSVVGNETWIRPGDYVKFAGSGSYKVLKMEGKRIHVEAPISDTGANVWLVNWETRHLIKKFNSDNAIVSDGTGDGDDIPYEL